MLFSLYFLAAVSWLLMALTKGYSGPTFSIGLGYIIASAFLMHWLNRQGDSLAKPTLWQHYQQNAVLLFIAPCMIVAGGMAILCLALLTYGSCALYWVLWKSALLLGNKKAANRYHIILHEHASFFGGLRHAPVIIRN